MTPTPDDIRKAREVISDLDCDWTWDSQSSGTREQREAIETIAQAIAEEREAERERCAGKAEGFGFKDLTDEPKDRIARVYTQACEDVAAYIRRSEP